MSAKNPVPPNLLPHCFLPGKSGNPGGVPKDKPFTQICKELLDEGVTKRDIKNTLRALVKNKKSKLSLDAMNTMADRVEGETVKRQEITGADGEPLELAIKLVKK